MQTSKINPLWDIALSVFSYAKIGEGIVIKIRFLIFMPIKFNFFKAGHGDSILISTEQTNILIDGGVDGTYKEEIEKKIDEIDKLDLVVLTHIDNDHICGLIEMLTENEEHVNKIDQLWFNSLGEVKVNEISNEKAFGQGLLFENLVSKYDFKHRKDIYLKEDNVYKIGSDIEIILLSPEKSTLNSQKNKWKNNKKIRLCNGKEVNEISGKSCIDNRSIDLIKENFLKNSSDSSLPNKTSISFILKYKNKKFLFLADAHISTINKSLINMSYSENKRLSVEFVKLSHHGSKNNINNKFLYLVKTNTFITLTDCSYHQHPDKETFSMILNHPKREENINLFFNYSEIIDKKFPRKKEEEKKYSFRSCYKPEVSY
jgi:beta-lactamase superfamily II metal-dependent hydrolase